ncbi:UDP-N-acetylglucosamine 2-epimerase (hydrolyzing) [Bradyrhizobium sp. WBOS7]|uniref:UDP-N-acetylglucosamine 2-epimerase (Hydrolyzing) n=1 Tax=Bradyrhizobium betae TaxID=244734 RepID=A0AAE9NHN7_9BRAD|nr:MULTISPECIES: UDP-N-acetylglucosamine 2-epimerase [Bradyrhizobium]MDD1569372.1 UDP-N-acetylglucosamine 2-epimerase (hydrolyzing) [Bradyrhizobium sp. WBOS1]UUO38163.1 UDP-N-acetylglucosamine 2-epimerase (hydrolyzing) [Bradyrhizobium sp. WBOS01]MDD1529845.1 UDP-N-acetylglucosamine 2-epimerase (hydrolyzing) [Bradyrhizobium sp. WBOS2]MDD1576491.1 UDP-N-acetylglucosamine 2-epimerase (hydrolyzing) [Bradyrhizobium sp. WBOS7]MDD1602332.1 UDP-N-acetylglucosamine 2-epimerase (hydrolyzing) [Bradyrhizo
MSKKKICVVVGSRANYSSIKSAMRAIKQHPALELQLIVAASAVLDRYGSVVNLIEKDGFTPHARVTMLIEGETPSTMAKSTGLGLLELPTLFEQLAPDVVLTVGDRFETMATTLAAAYMNIPVAHTMGGEVSGTIDESIRHAVTKFAHIHFPASEGARERIVRLGERPEHVHMVGCPRIDLVADILKNPIENIFDHLFDDGVGQRFSIDEPFALVSQHPVTTEYGDGEAQITMTLEAVRERGLAAVVLWPNADAGSDDISRGIRKWRERKLDDRMHFFKNLPIDIYVNLMNSTACLIGNSSSGIREGAYIGTPVVNIGSRQNMRDRGDNVIEVSYDKKQISNAIAKQLEHGRYAMNPIYGDGSAGPRIASVLAVEKVEIQKCITY